jgi:phosphotriesterase-related protein
MKCKIGLLVVMLLNFGGALVCAQGENGAHIMTVNGKLAVDDMGKTLIHEHIVTNFGGTEHPNQPFEGDQKVIETILPYLLHLKSLGFKTLFECTPSHIGKNAGLLQELSKRSGIHIVTNTGYYAAVDKKYLPEHVYTESSEILTERWLTEWQKGISDTGVYPGFIKLGVGKGTLDSIEQKVVKAGFMVSKKTGMALAIHTGDGASIKSQYQLALENNYNVNKLIWTHAQNGTDDERIGMAQKGIWISLDGVNETKLEAYVNMVVKLQEHSLLNRLLLSHDDGWSITHSNGQPKLELFQNGNSKPYRTISEKLTKRLFEKGFTKDQMDMILVENPKQIMAIQN